MKIILFFFCVLLLSSCTIITISDESISRYKKELELPMALDTIVVHNYRSFIFSYPLVEIKEDEQFLLELFKDQRKINRIDKKITLVEKKIKRMRDKQSKLRRKVVEYEKEKMKKKFEVDNKKEQFQLNNN